MKSTLANGSMESVGDKALITLLLETNMKASKNMFALYYIYFAPPRFSLSMFIQLLLTSALVLKWFIYI